jgi:integrase/recombinase XerC/integrase/recombinase XerD
MERGTSKPDDTSSPVEGRLSSLTVSSYLSAVKRFYSWVESMKYYPDVAKGIRAPKREHKFRRQPLLPDQAKKLLEYYQEKASRDYAIVNLLLRTGLRTIELRRADIQDITFIGSQRVLMIQGKGRSDKEDFVILTDKAYQPIEAYLKTRGISSPEEYLKAPGNKPGSDPLFISESNNSKGSRLTTRKISQIAKEGLKAIDLDNRAFTAHSLRHTTAVNILRAGGTLEDVQLTLRHRSSSTSQIYTHTLNEQRRLANGGEYMIDRLY